ncbi:hypothetical protein [Nocardioides litoris]|uniref:hypothetical protein n=1 Tax=Nocardioides litoris TaxID=1926648 RepID=UPI00112395D0|nr:hypothetical protein [Nocardioides litoris]
MLRRAALLLVLAGVAGCGGTESTDGGEPQAEHGPRVLFAGDFIAEDCYASSADRGFVSLVTEALDATPVRATQ